MAQLVHLVHAWTMAQSTQRKLSGKVGTIFTIGLGASLLLACGKSAVGAPSAGDADAQRFAKEALETPQLEASTPGSTQAAVRHVGDTTVHRFSGSFSKQALILKEEVLETGDETFSVRYTLDEGKKISELLVTRTNRSERIVSVSRLVSGQIVPASLSDYEALIEKTLFVPDQNQGEIATKSQTCLVGSSEHQCDIAEYRVYVADQEARLSVARSAELGRDVSGEVVAVDGTMIYRAELIEVQERKGPSHKDEVAIITGLE